MNDMDDRSVGEVAVVTGVSRGIEAVGGCAIAVHADFSRADEVAEVFRNRRH